tara:strand:+ start:10415 stop:11704 length:1290 start_codon:yes stop_codon:yes gene_type:complete
VPDLKNRKQKKFQISSKKKIAFVCSGGGTKAGAFHLGVALALQEQGFRFYGGLKNPETPADLPGPMDISTYVGSSAGAIIATLLAAGYSLESIVNSFTGKNPEDPDLASDLILPRLTYQKMFTIGSPGKRKDRIKQSVFLKKLISNFLKGDISSLIKLKWLTANSPITTSGIETYIREEVLASNEFKDYKSDLFLVTTQLNHSRKVVFGKYHYEPPAEDLSCEYSNEATISDACAASTALPFVFAPYTIKHKDKSVAYIDGEIRDTLSTHVGFDSGADLVICSHTHQPYHLSKEVGSLTNLGFPVILVQSLYLAIEQKINYHIESKKRVGLAVQAVHEYCKKEGISKEHSEQITQILERKLNHRMNTDTIYIHPRPHDHDTFLYEHFSLAPEKLTKIVKSGFLSAIDVLRKYEFEDRSKDQPSLKVVGS